MNAKLKNIIERITALPDDLLEEVEESLYEIERWHREVFRLRDEERTAVRKGMDASDATNSRLTRNWPHFTVVIADEGPHHAPGAR